MRLVDLDAKEPYVLDGRYSVNVMSLKPHVHIDFDAIRKEIEEKMTHGHWIIWESNLDNHATECKCSACGHQFICSPSFIKAANYCSNCGAKMNEVMPNDAKLS